MPRIWKCLLHGIRLWNNFQRTKDLASGMIFTQEWETKQVWTKAWAVFIISKPNSSIIEIGSSILSVITMKLMLQLSSILLRELGMCQPMPF